MADQEIVKHTKKVYKVWHSKEHSFTDKLKEFFLEIFIIVFAVTLSIWFHNWSEHRHQQNEVKEFLLGLKEDLSKDIKEMYEDKKSFKKSHDAFSYITEISDASQVNQDSLSKHMNWMQNTTGLVANDGRFEGFKSSGKIGNIENHNLQNSIMDLYQENIPTLINNTDGYSNLKLKFGEYLRENLVRDKETNKTNIEQLLFSNKAQNQASSLKRIDYIYTRYDTCIGKMKKIIAQINKEYN
jgi:Family of unknown function (DUF6090)